MAASRCFTRLTSADRQTPLWRRLRQELIAEVEILRTDLEKVQTETTTASIRSRLMLLREILALERDPATTAPRDLRALLSDE